MSHSQTTGGAPVESDAHSLSVGPNGPLALHDVHLVETLAHFNRENVVERKKRERLQKPQTEGLLPTWKWTKTRPRTGN